MSIEAMKQWLEALETINQLSAGENAICLPAEIDSLMDYLRQTIAEAEKQEPVAYIQTNRHCEEELVWDKDDELENGLYSYTPLYTSPPQRQWVGLTESEIIRCSSISILRFYDAIEAKLKEKNT